MRVRVSPSGTLVSLRTNSTSGATSLSVMVTLAEAGSPAM